MYEYFVSHEFFGIQEHYSNSKETTSGLLGGTESQHTYTLS